MWLVQRYAFVKLKSHERNQGTYVKEVGSASQDNYCGLSVCGRVMLAGTRKLFEPNANTQVEG